MPRRRRRRRGEPRRRPDAGAQAAWQRGLASGTTAVATGTGTSPTASARRRRSRAAAPLPRVMVGATTAMVVVTVALTVLAGPLYGVAERAAADLLDRTPYLTAVFGGRGEPAVSGDRRRTSRRPAGCATSCRCWSGWCWSGSCCGARGRGPTCSSGSSSALAVTCCCRCPRWSAGRGCARRACSGSSGLRGRPRASGAQVAWQTMRPGGIGSSAIIRVRLRTDSDLLLTMVAESLPWCPARW